MALSPPGHGDTPGDAGDVGDTPVSFLWGHPRVLPLGTPGPARGGRGRGGDVTYSFFTPRPRRIPACPRLSPGPECPHGVPAVSPAAVESREVLEALVAVVATLGGLMVIVAWQDWDVLRDVSPKSLRSGLRTFIWHVRVTLNHRSDVTSLGQALAALGANPGAPSTRARMTAVGSAWRESVAALMESWSRLAGEATELLEDWGDAATRSGQWPGLARGPLECLVAVCDKATVFPWELLRWLGDIELALEETKEASPDIPKALVASVAEAEQLWEASARLTRRHLLGTLGYIHRLLVSGTGGRGRYEVAEQCQRAIEDIPRLLGGALMSPM